VCVNVYLEKMLLHYRNVIWSNSRFFFQQLRIYGCNTPTESDSAGIALHWTLQCRIGQI
jgi:hypothetical protein